MFDSAAEARAIEGRLGLGPGLFAAGAMESRSPIDGRVIGSVAEASPAEVAEACARARAAFLA